MRVPHGPLCPLRRTTIVPGVIAPVPAEARSVHVAYAVSEQVRQALERVCAAIGSRDRAMIDVALAALPRAPRSAAKTPLDVALVRAAVSRIMALRPGSDTAQVVAALSLSPRLVDAGAEASLVTGATRLARLVELDAPSVIIENELGLIARAAHALDGRQEPDEPEATALLADELIAAAADPRFELSLGRFTAIGNALDERSGEEPLSLDEGPLAFHPAPGASSWFSWVISEDDHHLARIAGWRSTMASLEPRERREVNESITSDGLVAPPDDWLAAFDGLLRRIESNRRLARAEGLLILACELRD